MADVYTGLWIAGGLNLLVAVGSGGLALKTGGSLIRQLRRLQTHAQAIGRGDFEHAAESTGVRELAELATAFNQMGAAVRAAQEALEAANAASGTTRSRTHRRIGGDRPKAGANRAGTASRFAVRPRA